MGIAGRKCIRDSPEVHTEFKRLELTSIPQVAKIETEKLESGTYLELCRSPHLVDAMRRRRN
jgi:hypothetical protein